jgi:hypothetical protein
MPAPSATFTTGFSTTTTPKSVAVTANSGDTLVIWGSSENSVTTLGTPTGGSLTYTLQQSVVVASDSALYCWTATATGSVTIQITAGTGGDTWGFFVEVWPNTTVGASNKANLTTAAAPSVSLTTTAANSAISCFDSDFNANTTARTWLTINGITPTAGNGLENYYEAVSLAATYYHAYWNDAGAAGAKTAGLSAPNNQAYSIIALELKGTAAVGGPVGPVIAAAPTRRPAGSAVTLDHGTVIQSPAPDVPLVQVLPAAGTPPPRLGAAIVLGSRADQPASTPPVPEPFTSAGRPPVTAGSSWFTGSHADPDFPPSPEPLIASGRPPAPAGSSWLTASHAEPDFPPAPEPFITAARPAPQAGTSWIAGLRAPADAPTEPPTLAPSGRAPLPAGTTWLALTRADPPPDTAVPLPAVAAGRPAPQPGNAWLTASRAEPAVDAAPPPPIQAGRAPTPQVGAAQIIAPRADPAPNTPPAPQPFTTAAKPPALPGTAWIAAPRADPAATPDPMPSAPVTVPGRPRALPAAALVLRPVVDAPGGYPALTVAAGTRQSPAGTASLARSTFTPPPPVLYLRPPIQSPGIRLAVPGSVLLQRLTEQTGHVCPPPTPRPYAGTTANSAGDVTPRPYSGVTPVC